VESFEQARLWGSRWQGPSGRTAEIIHELRRTNISDRLHGARPDGRITATNDMMKLEFLGHSGRS
jgi:hypothetical protein